MSALGSALLLFGWVSGLVAGVATIRSLDQLAFPEAPRNRVVIGLTGVVLVSLWLPWVTSPNGQFTLSGWSGLDAATVVVLLLLIAGVGTLAIFPDRGGANRELLAMVLSLSLAGIIGGNVLIGASGAWDNELTWGAPVTLVASLALAGYQVRQHLADRALADVSW